jgi:hypothetical protein
MDWKALLSQEEMLQKGKKREGARLRNSSFPRFANVDLSSRCLAVV